MPLVLLSQCKADMLSCLQVVLYLLDTKNPRISSHAPMSLVPLSNLYPTVSWDCHEQQP